MDEGPGCFSRKKRTKNHIRDKTYDYGIYEGVRGNVRFVSLHMRRTNESYI